MKLRITKSARKFGYIIWSKKTNDEMMSLINGKDTIPVTFNGLNLGMRSVDWKYYRISIGYKITRAIPEEAPFYNLELKNGILEVIYTYDQE